MQAIKSMTASLKAHIQNLDTTANGEQLRLVIKSAFDVIQQINFLAKNLPYASLIDFINTNCIIVDQLHQIVQMHEGQNDTPLLSNTHAIMQQVAFAYQESVVPMLTRLNNLSDDPDNAIRITAITSLGNEIITCNSQINQFSEKFSANEKLLTILGILLMFSSISLLIIALSKPSLEIQPLDAIALMYLACNLFKLTMQQHAEDPGSDLILTSIKKMEPLILEIEKTNTPGSTEHKVAAKPAKATKAKTSKPKPVISVEEIDVEIDVEITEPSESPVAKTTKTKTVKDEEEESSSVSPKFMDKVKNVLDIFNKK